MAIVGLHGVRAGTLVWIRETECACDASSGLPAIREDAIGEESTSGLPDGATAPSLPPLAGGSRGGVVWRLAPIEGIRPGNLVVPHDGLPHPAHGVAQSSYHGEMVSLSMDASEASLWLTATHRLLARLRPRTLGGERDWSGSPETHRERRRELRREATVAERRL